MRSVNKDTVVVDCFKRDVHVSASMRKWHCALSDRALSMITGCILWSTDML